MAATPALATTINFDDGTIGTPVAARYAALGVTFSNTIFASSLSLPGTSGSVVIASQSAGFQYTFSAADALVGTFTGLASSLSFSASDVGAAGARLEAYNSAGVLIASNQFFGTGLGVGKFGTVSVAAAGIKSFRLFQPAFDATDGVLFDNFNFEATAVPEPAAWAMMIAGFAVAGASLRRRRAQARVTYA